MSARNDAHTNDMELVLMLWEFRNNAANDNNISINVWFDQERCDFV